MILTKRQKELFDYLDDYIARHGYAPTLEEIGAQIILGNTYHLFLRPGLEVIRKFGSLHAFSGWDKPILTDSGGFQIFSIKGNSKVTDRGVQFKSHLDGSTFFLSPEDVVDVQDVFDSDIQMVLDNFAGHPASREDDERSLEITHLWARRAREQFLAANTANLKAILPASTRKS